MIFLSPIKCIYDTTKKMRKIFGQFQKDQKFFSLMQKLIVDRWQA